MDQLLKYIKNPSRIIIWLDNHNIINLSDKQKISLEYKLAFGKYPDLENPETFNEKLQWLKLHDRNPEYTKMVDKYEAKEYVASIIGEGYIIPTLGIYDKFEDIDFDKLPNQFVMKCTHDSGGLVICKDKSNLDIGAAQKKINHFLKRSFYKEHREWPYKNIKPRIIIEEYIGNQDVPELNDYKMMCFNGKVSCSFVCTERYSQDGLKVTFFDLNWKKMPFKRHYPSSTSQILKPKNYKKMIELSEKLAQGIPFVRVDWYEVKGELYFGELTFFPGAGLEEFTPVVWDVILGGMLELPHTEKEAAK